MLDGSHHGKGEHDERDVTMPAVPGSGFVVVEPELVFGCLEAILDCPAMALDVISPTAISPTSPPGVRQGLRSRPWSASRAIAGRSRIASRQPKTRRQDIRSHPLVDP